MRILALSAADDLSEAVKLEQEREEIAAIEQAVLDPAGGFTYETKLD